MGLTGLAGKVTDSYPAQDVKAGIIPGVCVSERARQGGAARIHRWPSWNHWLQSLNDALTLGALSLFAQRTFVD